jgi:hypothetical protein
VRDDRHTDAVPPQLQLLDRRRAERVAGREDDPLAVAPKRLRQFRNAGCLADTVDADHQNDGGAKAAFGVRFVQPELSTWRRALEQIDQFQSQRLARLVRLLESFFAHATARRFKHLLGRLYARIGGDQDLLKLVPEFVVDLRPLERAEQPPEKAASRSPKRRRRPLLDIFVERRAGLFALVERFLFDPLLVGRFVLFFDCIEQILDRAADRGVGVSFGFERLVLVGDRDGGIVVLLLATEELEQRGPPRACSARRRDLSSADGRSPTSIRRGLSRSARAS